MNTKLPAFQKSDTATPFASSRDCPTVQTVFHVSTPEDVRTVVAKVRNLLADETVEMESVAVVLDSGAAIAELHNGSDLADDFRGLLAESVELKVCRNAAQHPDVSEADLLEGVEVVSSGVGELTRLQNGGYAYIRI
jgi:intracellular sulfur oxidation DsrE/DsrF family protein